MTDLSAIAAISTPLGTGGVGIIRISGKNSAEIADRIFVSASGKKLTESKGYRAHFGRIFDGETPVDEVVCLVFRAPHSYTGEDVVEINCHGGIFLMKKILRLVLQNGAQPAAPGEFTKRAFLNGKLDLSEAESVMTLISAQGEQGANAAFNQLEGKLSKKIESINSALLGLAAHIAAWVDYPDDEIPDLDFDVLLNSLNEVYEGLNGLLCKFDAGKALTDGIETAIVGKPNVGKSALMNMLSGFRRSIVTDIAGTTRDVVEETVRVGRVILNLADTAGIRESEDAVESIGVELAKEKIERAGLILAVFDVSRDLDKSDDEILELCKGREVIGVINKTDLARKADIEKIKGSISEVIFTSALKGDGEKELSDAIERALGTDKIDTSQAMLTTERQRRSAEKALSSIKEAIDAVDMGMTMDAVNVCIDSAIECLLELTGKKAREAVVDEVFSQFCVGK